MTAHAADHARFDTHQVYVDAVGTPRTPPNPSPHSTRMAAGCDTSRTPLSATGTPATSSRARVVEYEARNTEITFLAETLNDLEDLRKATGNRVWQLEHGDYAGLDASVAIALGSDLEAVEASVVKQLEKAMRRHPLGMWMQSPDTRGVGLKQGARLLAAVGNPYWNCLDQRPRRGPAELWAYCGFHVLPASQTFSDIHASSVGGHPLTGTDHGTSEIHRTLVGAGQLLLPDDQTRNDSHEGAVVGVAPRRAKGKRANWSSQARSRAWLVATSCVKQPAGTRYRDIYDNGRAKYADAVHQTTCAQCSAKPGDPLRPGHQHARALRLIAKAVLKDVFVEARNWHLREDS